MACGTEGGQHVVAVLDQGAATHVLGQAMDVEFHQAGSLFRWAAMSRAACSGGLL